MGCVIIEDRVGKVSRLSEMEATAVDYREGRYQIELTGQGRTIVVQLSSMEAIGLSAKLRSEIAECTERRAWNGHELPHNEEHGEAFPRSSRTRTTPTRKRASRMLQQRSS